MEYRQVQTIGGRGAGPGQFTSTLRALSIDRKDLLYAVGDTHVNVFDRGGRLLRRWTTAKPGTAVAVREDGSVYVGEAGQIERFDSGGKRVDAWRDDEHLGEVTAIGFVRDFVLAADAKDRSIRRFDTSGRFLNTIGKDNRTHGFLIPNGVLDFSVDGEVIHAANPGKHRVERYTCEGELLGHVGRFDWLDPSGFPGCCNPTNVEVAGGGRLYVTEKAGPRAKVLNADGKLIAVIATSVFDPNCKNMDLAVDSRGRVYVADPVRLRILGFEPVV